MIILLALLAVSVAAIANETSLIGPLPYPPRDSRSATGIAKALENLREANEALRREPPSQKNEKKVLQARKAVKKATDRACGDGLETLQTTLNETAVEIEQGCVAVKFNADINACTVTYGCIATTTFSKTSELD